MRQYLGGYLYILQTVNDMGIPYIWHVEFISQQPPPTAAFLHFAARFQTALKTCYNREHDEAWQRMYVYTHAYNGVHKEFMCFTLPH